MVGTIHRFNFDFNDAKPQRGEENRLPPEVSFVDFIKEKGFNPPEFVIQDGTIHRYGKNKVDWYVYFPDGDNAGGSFGAWNSDEDNINWSYLGANMSDSQRLQHESRMRQIHKQINEERQRIHAQAREEVAKVWAEAKEVETHPYLTRKGVGAHGIRLHKGDLLIPYRDKDGLLHSLQRITAAGAKLNWAGGAVAGYYHTIKGMGKFAYLCEGYATGATIHEATGATVYIAFSSGNLKTVSPLLPDNVIVAADDDRDTKGNPGLSAALSTKRQVISPKGLKGTDFNDLASEKGLDEVRRQLNQSTNKYTKRVLIGKDLHAGFLQTLKMGWTVDKILPESSALSVVFGPPSGGKSFTVLDLCCSIDSGTLWHGRKVKQKPVLYLAAEGQAGMLKRIEAWKQRRKVELPTFALLPMPCLIDEDSQRRELLNMITELPKKPGVIVLDTLARSMQGDENSTSDMGKVVIAASILIEETGAQVIIIHHTGKDEARGPRGAIALTGATDSMFKVMRLKEDKKFVLLCERQKDDEPFAPMVFQFEVIDTGFLNVDGSPVTSLVPEFDQEATEELGKNGTQKKEKITATQRRVLKALRDAIKEHGIPLSDEIKERLTGLITPNDQMVTINQWRKEAKRKNISEGDVRAVNQAFDRAKDALEAKEYIGMLDGYVWEQKEQK
jgi:putative DNA primase/helicase